MAHAGGAFGGCRIRDPRLYEQDAIINSDDASGSRPARHSSSWTRADDPGGSRGGATETTEFDSIHDEPTTRAPRTLGIQGRLGFHDAGAGIHADALEDSIDGGFAVLVGPFE
jgi:hypothetical protein